MEGVGWPNALHPNDRKWKGKLILKIFAGRKVKVNPGTDKHVHNANHLDHKFTYLVSIVWYDYKFPEAWTIWAAGILVILFVCKLSTSTIPFLHYICCNLNYQPQSSMLTINKLISQETWKITHKNARKQVEELFGRKEGF